MADHDRKPDAAAIIQFIDELEGVPWLGRRRRAWVPRLYHFTDVRNAASILRDGLDLSREGCRRTGVRIVDAADREVININPAAHNYVRLYYRPRTPTQYHMEGILSAERIRNGAHCPVPVFFVFNSRRLLTRPTSLFAPGNLASIPVSRLASDVAFLRELPFEDVYHDGYLPEDQTRKQEIIFRRHAEVVFEGSLDLDDLQEVVCRTGPERDTLLYLLGEEADRWQSIIRLERSGEFMFHADRLQVVTVTLLGRQVTFTTSLRKGPWRIRVSVVRAPDGAPIGQRTGTVEQLGLLQTIPLVSSPRRARVTIEINDCLAYDAVLTQQSLF